MDAVVTAGGIPTPEDPLFEYSQGKSKALIDISGKPMIQWVLDALSSAETIDNVIIVGLDASSGVSCIKPMTFIANCGGMLENIIAGIDKAYSISPDAEFVLMVSSDIPAITGEMVDWTVNKSRETDDDLYYCVVARDDMERNFPGANRSYLRLKDAVVCGADMNVIRASIARDKREMWDRFIATRKNVLKQAAMIGYDTLFLILIRRLSLSEVVPKASRRLGVKGRAILSPYPAVAMDVDKPYQLKLLRSKLSQQEV